MSTHQPAPRSPHHSIQVEGEEDGGEEEEGECGRPWYVIPRAALRRPSGAGGGTGGGPGGGASPPASSTTSSTATLHNTVTDWLDRSPPSSNTSTQSGSSGSLLLTAANLAALRLETGASTKEADQASLASSTHFTVVNYGRGKPAPRTICQRHTVSALVISTCSVFLLGLLLAVYYIDMRTQHIKYS